MKILVFAIGTRGDVQPFIAVGTALQARGHAVTLSAPKSFTAMVEASGLTPAPLPVDFQALIEEPEIKAAMQSFSGKLKAYRWASEIMNEQMSEMWRIGCEVEPDLILHHFKGQMAPYIGRRFNSPSIPLMLQPGFMPTREYPQFLIASRNLGGLGNLMSHKLIMALTRMGTKMMTKRWLKVSDADVGPLMDPVAAYDPNGPGKRLHAYSDLLVPRPKAWPDTEILTGYPFTAPEDYAPSDELAAFLEDGERPIYVGFGSMPGIDHDRTTRALLGALESTGRRAVVATGWGGIKDVETNGRIHVLEAVPHSWLFPRVAAVVHHGGSGTTHEGLRWGKPSVICPLFADQPFFGERVAALGAGPRPIHQKRLTAEKLAAAIEQALSPAVMARAAEIGAQMRAEDGVGRIVEVIEGAA